MLSALWELYKPDFVLQRTLARALNISPVTAQVLINRGIRTVEEAKVFFYGGVEALRSSHALPDMEKALRRLYEAVQRQEKILIYGDYDVDGISAAAIVGETLAKLGVEVEFYIPHRLEEGYGLKIAGLSYAISQGCALVISVDCGITAVQEAAWAREQGLDLIITDHHRPGEQLPPALAVVDPWLSSWEGPNLAGAGVAFKLARGLAEMLSLPPEAGTLAGWALDLVALGTIADSMPLLGENRILVRKGLELLKEAKRPGIKALLEVAGLNPSELNAERIAFGLVPRLNAAGRLGSARPALELLLTTSPQKAWELAQMLNRENGTRQLLEEQILAEAMLQAEAAVERGDPGVVLAGTGWHPGVLGIVAGKLAERFGRPAILIALDQEGKGRGSGRSIAGIDLFNIIHSCRQYLLSCGGHGQAIGLEIAADQVVSFREAFLAALEIACGEERPQPRLQLEAEVLFSQLDKRLVEELENLAPFGEDNPRPLFLYRGARIVAARQVGSEGLHTKLQVQAEGRELPAIGFRMVLPDNIAVGSKVDLAFRPTINTFNGQEDLELVIAALQPAESSVIVVKTHLPGLKGVAEAREGGAREQVTWAGAILKELKKHLDNNGRTGKLVFASGRGVLTCYYGLKNMLPSEEIFLLARGPWLPGGKSAHLLSPGTIILQPLELVSEEELQDEDWQLWSPEAARLFPEGQVLSFGGEMTINGVIADPLRCALEMVAEGKRVLIYAADYGQARELARSLRQRAECKVVLDEGLTAEQKAIIHHGSLVGEFPLLVGIGSRPAWFYPAQVIIFAYLPHGREEMELAIPPQENRPQVYISAKVLTKGPPGAQSLRPFLLSLYKRLEALTLGQKAVYLHKQIAGKYLFQCSLNILEELGLINCVEDNKGLKVWLNSSVQGKRDLNNSWRYRQLCRDCEAAFALWRELKEGLGR